MSDDLRPACVLLLPRPLPDFILREQAEDLLRGDDVVAVDPPRPGYGAALRLPEGAADAVAGRQAASIVRGLERDGRHARVVVFFHATQQPVAAAVRARTGAELWYWRWDRYETAGDADEARRARLSALHRRAAQAASLVVASSVRLEALARDEGRPTVLSPLAADDFPAPEPTPGIVAFSLGHLGRRTDWALLRGVGERLPDLQVLFVGEVHPDEVPGDQDFAWCREHPPFVFLGPLPDAAAAQVLRLTDVAILPFVHDAFNDAGLPYRILKAARLGRRTITPDLAGVRTWDPAVTVAPDVDAYAAALTEAAGRRSAPDEGLRAWAVEQTAEHQNAPLRERLRGLRLDAG